MASKSNSGSSPENWSQLESLIEVTNKDLRARGHKASLVVHQDLISIRGTFPTEEGRKRIRISTAVKATIKGVALAETRLIDLLAAVKNTGAIPNPLPWANKEISSTGYPKVKVRDAIAQLKKQFFSTKTPNEESRQNTWNTMNYGLKKLDPGAYVTVDYLLAQVIDKSINTKTGEPSANMKLKLKQYYKRLAKTVNLPDINKFDDIETPYEPEERIIPWQLEDGILEFAEQVRSHPRYGWLTCAMIFYGCRPSESFFLTPNASGSATTYTIKQKKKLPKKRNAMILPGEINYIKKLNLLDINRPLTFKNAADFSPNASKTICDSWLKWIVKEMPELELYDLRHFWARRSIRQNVPTGLAVKTMGTSYKIFENTYLKTMDEGDIEDYLRRNKS